MKGKTFLQLLVLGTSLGAQNSANPEFRFLLEERQGRAEATEVRAETADWGAWVRSREASALGGARFGPVMVGPLLLTSPGPERWGWAWNRRAAAGSFGAVAGWNGPFSLWISQNSAADECGIQARGQWAEWGAAGAYRRRMPAGNLNRPEGSWVDQIRGGLTWKNRALSWENGGSVYLPQRGGRGLEGTSRFRCRWENQEFRTEWTGTGGATMDEKEGWKGSAGWEFPWFGGCLDLSGTLKASRPADSTALRWSLNETAWDFYTRTLWAWGDSPDHPRSWDQGLGWVWKSRRFLAGIEAGGGRDEEQWKLRGALQGEGSGWGVPGRWTLRLDSKGALEESGWEVGYTATLEWKSPEDRARFTLSWTREPRPWDEVPRWELNGLHTETCLTLELRW